MALEPERERERDTAYRGCCLCVLRLPPSPSTKSATNLGSFAEGDEEDD